MKYGRFLILIFLFLGTSQVSRAQTPRQLTLRECLKAALSQHPSAKAARRVEEERAAETRRLKAQQFPQLNFVSTAGVFRFSPYHYRTFQNNVEVTWDAGKWFGKLAELGIVGEELALLRTKQNQLKLALEVKQAFYQLVQSRQMLRVAGVSRTYLQHHLKISKALFRVGQIDRLDLFRTQARLSEAREAVATAKNRCKQCRIQLRNLTGLALSENDSLIWPLEEIETSHPTLDTLLAQARRNNPALKLLEQEIRRTKLRQKLVHASRLPSVTLSGGFVLDNDPTSGGNYAVVQGGLRLPLVDWRSRKIQKQALRLHAASLRETQKALLLEIRTQLESLFAQLRYLNSLKVLKGKTLSEARQAYFLTEKTYRAGAATNTDVLLAQKEWIRAKLARETIDVQIQFARAELDFWLGKTGVFR